MLGNSINIKNFNWNPVVLKNLLRKITIFLPSLCKNVPMGHTQNKKVFFFRKNNQILREHQQLGFIMLNNNLAVNLKATHPSQSLLNGRGEFTKSSNSDGIVVYPTKFELLRN